MPLWQRRRKKRARGLGPYLPNFGAAEWTLSPNAESILLVVFRPRRRRRANLGHAGSRRSSVLSRSLEAREQDVDRVRQFRPVHRRHLATARVPGGNEAPVMARVGHPFRPAQSVDRFRAFPVGTLVTVQPGHATAPGRQHAQVDPEPARDLHPIGGRGRRVRSLGAMRQQMPVGGRIAIERRQAVEVLEQPLLRQGDGGYSRLAEAPSHTQPGT